ncbi:MAG: acyl-CoA dehydrogenase family protein [Cytophagales bacterium]|nr:acyl-CoA dehydrogenase family protein [Cytophagales bacterium]
MDVNTDFYEINRFLTTEQILVRDTIKKFIFENISPYIEKWCQEAYFPTHLVKEFGKIGLFGITIPTQYGGSSLDYITYGLAMQEVERGDSGLRSMVSVQNSLVMYPIYMFGSEEQKTKYLAKLANGELLGCFGLTEPNHGSDPSAMLTHFADAGDYIILNGSKMWISNSPMADIAIVWAKNPQDRIQGIIVQKDMAGFSAPYIHNKWSLRASITGELVFDNVKIPKQNILPLKDGLGAPLMCLDSARYGISWGAIGAAMDCYETALKYSLQRVQFGKPIASFQLIQKKLAEMLTDITKAQLLSWRLGILMNENKASSAQISMAKRNNVQMAANVAREARQILGAMGITGDYPIMRHMMNIESVLTYEGTHDIHLLILGKEITGISAFF